MPGERQGGGEEGFLFCILPFIYKIWIFLTAWVDLLPLLKKIHTCLVTPLASIMFRPYAKRVSVSCVHLGLSYKSALNFPWCCHLQKPLPCPQCPPTPPPGEARADHHTQAVLLDSMLPLLSLPNFHSAFNLVPGSAPKGQHLF